MQGEPETDGAGAAAVIAGVSDALPQAVLRRPEVEHLPGIFAVHSDPEVYRLDPQETHTDIEYTLRWTRPIFDHWERHGFGYWTVLSPAEWWPDGPTLDAVPGMVVAGMGGIQHFRWNDPVHTPVLNVYYRFGPRVQGHGLGRVVIDASMAFAETHVPNLDLVVRTRPANGAAQHVARRAGFVDDGLDPDDANMVVLRRPARRAVDR